MIKNNYICVTTTTSQRGSTTHAVKWRTRTLYIRRRQSKKLYESSLQSTYIYNHYLFVGRGFVTRGLCRQGVVSPTRLLISTRNNVVVTSEIKLF